MAKVGLDMALVFLTSLWITYIYNEVILCLVVLEGIDFSFSFTSNQGIKYRSARGKTDIRLVLRLNVQ